MKIVALLVNGSDRKRKMTAQSVFQCPGKSHPRNPAITCACSAVPPSRLLHSCQQINVDEVFGTHNGLARRRTAELYTTRRQEHKRLRRIAAPLPVATLSSFAAFVELVNRRMAPVAPLRRKTEHLYHRV